jgi:hypothetical protein
MDAESHLKPGGGTRRVMLSCKLLIGYTHITSFDKKAMISQEGGMTVWITGLRFGGLNLIFLVARPESDPLKTDELLADDRALAIEFIRLVGENLEAGPSVKFPGPIGADLELWSTMGRARGTGEPVAGSVWLRLGFGTAVLRNGRSWEMVVGAGSGGLTVSASEISGDGVEHWSIGAPSGKTPSDVTIFESSPTPWRSFSE